MKQSVKDLGAYYTPPKVVRFLIDWATAGQESGDVLDPSCGDGRFIENIPGAFGVDIDPNAVRLASNRCQQQTIVHADFFRWADSTTKRFSSVVGNPPFIRYQRFAGEQRHVALQYCAKLGITLSALSSSWAPFVIGASSLLKPGGRLAFVVPAEISYAVYARQVLQYLLHNFATVEVLAVQEKLFPQLSEDCWLIRASSYGGTARTLTFRTAIQFDYNESRWASEDIPVSDLERSNYRLRPFLLPSDVREAYWSRSKANGVLRLGDVAKVQIGYVTGANDFFHLKPSQAAALGIKESYLRPAVRSNRDLNRPDISQAVIQEWIEADKQFLLLDLNGIGKPPKPVQRLLDSDAGQRAREAYKCRYRNPWYGVPDVNVPDAFLSLMSNGGPRLVGNSGKCVGTNSIHTVFLNGGISVEDIMRVWYNELTQLSCEVEGHGLGGGMLKLEPARARKILLDFSETPKPPEEKQLLTLGIETMRAWRHSRGS